MPQNTKGCYEKIGYPRVLRFGEDDWVFKVSGATRMIYECDARPQAVAKIMPAKASPYWRQGWDQNSVEATALEQMRDVSFVLGPSWGHDALRPTNSPASRWPGEGLNPSPGTGKTW